MHDECEDTSLTIDSELALNQAFEAREYKRIADNAVKMGVLRSQCHCATVLPASIFAPTTRSTKCPSSGLHGEKAATL